jgi:hypothetical protein
MTTKQWNKLVRNLEKLERAKKRTSRNFKQPKEIKLVWMKAPCPFNQEKLRASIRAYVARQRKLKAEIMSGKFPIRFGNAASRELCSPAVPRIVTEVRRVLRRTATRRQVEREILQVRANAVAVDEVLN